MDITSEKRWKTLPVTDLDIVYLGGSTDQITYGEHDAVYDYDDRIEILIRNDKGEKTVERLIALKRNMLSYRYRERLLKIEDRTPLPTEPVKVDDPSAG